METNYLKYRRLTVYNGCFSTRIRMLATNISYNINVFKLLFAYSKPRRQRMFFKIIQIQELILMYLVWYFYVMIFRVYEHATNSYKKVKTFLFSSLLFFESTFCDRVGTIFKILR